MVETLAKKEIKKRGLKKSYVASQIGMSPSEFSLMINGVRKYNSKRAQLHEFLGISSKK